MWLYPVIAYTFLFLLVLVSSAFIAFIVYLVHIHRQYSHIPSPTLENFLLGHIPTIKRKRRQGKVFSEIIREFSLEHGNVFVLWFLHMPLLLVLGSEETKKVIVTLNLPKSKGCYVNLKNVFGARASGQGILVECDHEVWLRKRMLLNAAFHRKYLMNLMPEFNSICDHFIEKIGTFADQNVVVNFAEEFARVTLDVIGKVAFDVDLNAVEDENCPFLLANYLVIKGMQETFTDIFWRINILGYPFQRKVIKASQFIREYGRKTITERIAAIKDGKDTPNDILQHIILMTANNPSITLEELVDEFVTFFIAGQETTSNLLAFTLYETEKNADIKRKLVQEVDTVFEEKRYVGYEDLGKLEYLGQILKESLRLHPPVTGLSRYNYNEIELGGYKIPAGTEIRVSIFAPNRSADNWPNPEIFDPDRFAPPNNFPSETYFPFSLGPRSCIGKNLAQFESKAIIARLYQEFDFELPDCRMTYEEAITLRPGNGVWCTVRRR